MSATIAVKSPGLAVIAYFFVKNSSKNFLNSSLLSKDLNELKTSYQQIQISHQYLLKPNVKFHNRREDFSVYLFTEPQKTYTACLACEPSVIYFFVYIVSGITVCTCLRQFFPIGISHRLVERLKVGFHETVGHFDVYIEIFLFQQLY